MFILPGLVLMYIMMGIFRFKTRKRRTRALPELRLAKY